MDKYIIYPNIYKLLNHCDNNNICQNIQKLIIIILQNAENIYLTSGQIKLAFCFISKVKPVLYDVNQSLKIIHSELLADYSPIQLAMINTLLSCNNIDNIINSNKPISLNNYPLSTILERLGTTNNITTQDQYNHILLASCDYIESYPQIPNNPIINQLVNCWFYLDEMYL